MSPWQILFWVAVLLGAIALLFLLDRLGCWLEKRGLLYYRHKKPESSALSSFVAMQQIIEPPSKHVFEIKDEKRKQSQEDAG
jgi:hypothetical protein